MNQFAQHLEHIAVGAPVAAGNLAMFPLFHDDPQARADGAKTADYLGFDEAVEREQVSVTEIDDGGSVPTLLLDNHAAQPVFLLDGEQLIGAKQNRTVNLSLLVAGGVKTEIPVSCVEAGRWSRNSRKFHGSRHMHYSRGRRDKMAQVNRNLRQHKSRRADQGQVWSSIADKRAAFAAEAPTAAMDDIYESATARLSDYERGLTPAPRQVGAVFAIDGEASGFDLFADAAQCAKYFSKLVGSHALDALESANQPGNTRRKMRSKMRDKAYGEASGESSGESSDKARDELPAREVATAFLQRFAVAAEEVHDAIGLGSDVRVESAEVIGAGLVLEDECVHLAGFPKEDDGVRR
ncbi:MAG: ARPP-1 family domain-containing protein [bacterium]